MKRAIITISESELVGLFGVAAPALKAASEPYTKAEW